MTESPWPLWFPRDPVSAATHFLGFLAAVAGAVHLWRVSRGGRRWALWCFSSSAVLLYAASAAYHTVRLPPEEVQVFRQVDHSAIFLLIAGTYTPVILVLLRDRLRKWLLFAAVWLLAGLGIVSTWFLPAPPYPLTVAFYLGFGWTGLIPLGELARAVGWRGLAWAAAGGLAYSLGGVADLACWPICVPGVVGPHEVFHVCALVGTWCQYVFMVRFVVPYPGRPT